jgi:FkbM family methyltransferase
MNNKSWVPLSTFEEKLKHLLIPSGFYIKHLIKKHLKKGESELHLLRFLVNPDKDAIDVGANKGIYSYLLAQLVQHVYAFEPNPKIFRILKKHLPENARAYDVALSDKNGDGELLVPKSVKNDRYSNQGASLSTVKVSGPHRKVDVKERTLDSYEFNNIGFIKIDVEGFESTVLKGAVNTIKQNMPTLLIELEERHTGRPVVELVHEVENYGYKAFYLKQAQLTCFSQFNPVLEHRETINQRDYVNNFLFFPD